MLPIALDYVVTLGYDTLIIFMSLIFFSFAYYSDKDNELLKPILYWFDCFLFCVAGLVYIGDHMYLGIILFCAGVLTSFIGAYYSLNYGR